MKKEYIAPVIEIENIEVDDLMVASTVSPAVGKEPGPTFDWGHDFKF